MQSARNSGPRSWKSFPTWHGLVLHLVLVAAGAAGLACAPASEEDPAKGGNSVGAPSSIPDPDMAAAPGRAIPGATPNLLILSIDTLRADRVGVCAGTAETPASLTPNLDAFALGGTVFDAASTPSPWTLPAHASLVTGLYPSHHGATQSRSRLARKITSLASRLRRRGFETVGIVNSWLLARTGLERGHGHFRYLPEDVAQRAPAPLVDEVRDWLEERSSRASEPEPFYLFLHSYDVHSDYASRPEYEQGGTYSGPIDGTTRQLKSVRKGELQLEAADRAEVERLYDAGVRQFDDVLGELIALLREHGALENTVVIVTSDHGEEFFEHGGVLHGQTHFDEVARVPLILRGPGVPAGLHVAEPVSLVDVVPTVLSLLRLDSRAQFDGVDLSASWLPGAMLPERSLFFEADHRGDEPGTLRAIRSGPLKLHFDVATGRAQLFDLQSDPGEQRDARAAHPERFDALMLSLREFLSYEATAGENGELSPEERALLESLGYH